MYVHEARQTLVGHKLRSFITVVGLVIGVASVVAIQVTGAGVAGAITATLSAFNDHAFIVFPKAQQKNPRAAAVRVADLAAVKRDVPEISDAIPAGGKQEIVHAGHRRYRLVVYPESETQLATAPLAQGRSLVADDVRDALLVCVLSDKAYRDFFPDGESAIGRSVYAGLNRYVVVGVQAPPRTGIINVNFTGDVAIPYTTYVNRYLGARIAYAGRFTAADGVAIAVAESAVIAELRRLHHGSSAEYQTFDKQSTTKVIDSIFAIITLAVALLGAVSLLVAGIGIMNIMLVSVTERVREIGIRKAIGARRGQILVQFLVEALLLSSFGCAMGLTLGLAAGWLVNRFAIVAITGYLTPLPWLQSTVIAALFATGVTVAFGTYPAFCAARLDPIEALRHE